MKIKREYSITLLVLLGIGLLIFGINFLKGIDIFQKRNMFHVAYGNVTGINPSSPVYYNGFKVGQVIRTQLMPGAGGNILVSFQLDESGLDVPRDTKVQIYSSDIFSRALQLLPGTSADLAQPGDTLQGDTQLSLTDAVGEQMDPLKKKAEGMLASVDSVLTSLQSVLNDSARRDIDASFASIRGTLESLNNSARRIDDMIATERATIHGVLDNIQQVTGNLVQYNEEIARILSNMDTVTTALASGGIQKVIDDLSATSGQLKVMMDRMENGEGTLGALLHNDTLYHNLQSASLELDMLLEDLRINPNRYMHLSLFGKKDRLPKLSKTDVDRIKRSLEEDNKIP